MPKATKVPARNAARKRASVPGEEHVDADHEEDRRGGLASVPWTVGDLVTTVCGRETGATNQPCLSTGVWEFADKRSAGYELPKDRPIPKVAGAIGVSPETLRIWARKDEVDAGEQDVLTTEEKEELRRLRREVKTLRQEKEILRKAAVDSTGERNGLGQCGSRGALA
jgi:transposase